MPQVLQVFECRGRDIVDLIHVKETDKRDSKLKYIKKFDSLTRLIEFD